ncbi:MAG: type II toxin-antitoxin system prevent-host-death family antitoxin [Chloroflexi bacterium]|nr:type II toxin-antitoxin system prevent-host-death family antitoxin [Chloroflexota bacterium]
MITVTASGLKGRFGQIMDQARREPVLVQSHGRDTVVILDHVEFTRLRHLEDAYWTARAEEALKSGFLRPEETIARLQSRLAAADAE